MSRLTDNDKHLGKSITFGRTTWRALRLVFSSGGGTDDFNHNHLMVYAFGNVARIKLPTMIQPWRRKIKATTWDAATIERMGRDWYFEEYPRKYGFSLNEGFLQVFHGAQTHDSTTTKSWCTHLPWTQWRHVRHSFFDGNGDHFCTEWQRPRSFKFKDSWHAKRAAEQACPSARFEFDDYDGQRITATCKVEECEWHFGEGWFSWLCLFRKPKVRRSLSLEFSSEVGPEKGSWKGGTLGHGAEMEPGETPEAAFRRYCQQEHRSKYRPFRITFVGPAQPERQKEEA